MSILAGIDFSEASCRAAEVAAHLALRAQVPLWLVHVRARGGEVLRTAEEAEQLLERLKAEAARLEPLGIKPELLLTSGNPEEELAAAATAREATLVVVSALGRRAGAWQLGSTAERLAQTGAIPLLVVRDSRPIEEWARGRRPLRVLLGADFSRSSDAAVAWVKALRKLGPCDVIATHLYWPPEERARLGMRGPVAIFEHNPDLEAILARDLLVRLGELPGSGEVRVRIGLGLGRLGDHLVSWAEQERADLIVVGQHPRSTLGRWWHGSVSQTVLHQAPVSVACIPLAAAAAEDRERVPEIRRILVPVDLSPASARAVAYAFAAAGPGKTVTLLHVLEAPVASATSPSAGALEPPERAAHKAELRPRLLGLVPPDAAARGIAVELEFADSHSVSRAILQAAERSDADLICMASHGRGTLARALVGSVTEEVVRGSERAVMIVR